MSGTISRAVGSIMDHFRAAPAAAPAGAMIPGTNQPAANAAPTATQNPTVPSSATPQSDGKGPGAFPAVPKDGDQAPLDGFKDLWQIDDKDKKQLPPIAPQIAMDPTKMREAAGKINFAAAIDPEVAKKAIGGDAEAFAQVMNSVAQATLVQSSAISAKVTEEALRKQAEAFQARIPDILRNHEISTGLRASSPVYENPALAPLVSMVESQMAQKYPTASPEEIKKQVESYLQQSAEVIVGGAGRQVITPDTKQAANKAKETDWEKFLTTGG